MIRMQYLGTGAAEGFPGVFCECPACLKARAIGGKNIKMRSCTLLNDHILIDMSPDLFAQGLRWNVTLSQIDHLVITHSHRDHLDPYLLYTRMKPGATILPENSSGKRRFQIWCSPQAQEAVNVGITVESGADWDYFRCHAIHLGERVSVGELTFIPLRAVHKKDELCYIYAITDGTKNLLYANDTGSLPDETFSAMIDTGMQFDVVSMDCARGILPGDGHMGLEENRKMKERLFEIGAATEKTRFYLNHFSHMCGLTHDEFQPLAASYGFTVAWDGLNINV